MPTKAAPHSERILFVDDERSVRRAFSRAVRKEGYAVDEACDQDEAVAMASRYGYAVIATDFRLVDGDGFSLVRRLSVLQPDAAYLMITGCAKDRLPDEDDSRALIKEIIFKPWSAQELTAAVCRGIDRHNERVALRHIQFATQTESQQTRHCRVLLIEENPSDVELVRFMLSRSDEATFDLEVVASVSEAKQRLASDLRFDAILIDLPWDDAKGLMAVAMIHRHAQGLPLVVLSNRLDLKLAVQSVQIGAQDYLAKDSINQYSLVRSILFAGGRARAQERLAYLSNYNPLTGLPNRVLFHDRLARSIARGERNQRCVGLLLLNLDRFKDINQNYGHEVGDVVLGQVAERLRNASRGSDTVAHLNGDEFALVLEDIGGEKDASVAARRVLRAMTRAFRIQDRDILVTLSIGVAVYSPGGSAEQLAKDADDAMYRAKKLGRNQYYVRSPDPRAASSDRLSLESDLSAALERQEFRLHYQPKVEIATGVVVGAEALLRWQHPTEGLVSPGRFIPLLEETGLIAPVGEWVIREACRQAKSWQAEGFGPLRISVNLSARQFKWDNIVEGVGRVLEEVSVDPSVLELELTESLLFDSSDATLTTLAGLKSLGIRLSIDDFGTGYSSLSYLNRYPIDELKIDRSFVSGIPGDAHAESIAGAIIGLSHNLDLKVVAEGVETSEQLDFLRAHRCDVVQGFFCAKPMSVEDFGPWLRLSQPVQCVLPAA